MRTINGREYVRKMHNATKSEAKRFATGLKSRAGITSVRIIKVKRGKYEVWVNSY